MQTNQKQIQEYHISQVTWIIKLNLEFHIKVPWITIRIKINLHIKQVLMVSIALKRDIQQQLKRILSQKNSIHSFKLQNLEISKGKKHNFKILTYSLSLHTTKIIMNIKVNKARNGLHCKVVLLILTILTYSTKAWTVITGAHLAAIIIELLAFKVNK